MEIINDNTNETNKDIIENKENVTINTKEELVNNIREWIKLDNDISKMKTEIRNKNNKKKELTNNLVNVMKSNAIDCFDVNGGSLVYKKRKTKKPISGKFLLAQLQEFYKEQPNIAEELTNKILENREETIKEEIKRKVKK
jgi:oligoribonuclease (3'-5' exoribonuclease)